MKRAVHEPVRIDDGQDVYPGVHLKAAAQMVAVLRARPFQRGNARVALLSTAVFLNLNGYDLEAGREDLLALVAVAADGGLTLLQIAAILERLSVRLRPSPG